MPTAFDEFSERAHRNFKDLPKDALRNRKILEDAMVAEGFVGLPTEWWHFDAPEWAEYSLRDEPLGSPSLLTDRLAFSSLPSHAKQLLVVTSSDWAASTGTLRRYTRAGKGWKKVGSEWAVSLGARGLAWGCGLHADGKTGPTKKEGDNTAPAGLFRVGQAYGYDAAAPSGSRWPYQQVTPGWICVDDPRSSSYNRVFSPASGVKRDWSSAEIMRRADHLYKWIINVEQNVPDPKPGCGSCIFLHVWRRPGAPTEGCTAMEENRMVDLLKWLRPDAAPHLVQLPEDIYRKVRTTWGLP
jgi:D-alanyl-D-alanine dipeptidase